MIVFGIVGQDITGNVVLDYRDVNNCSNSEIEDLWNWIFIQGDSGIQISKEFEAGGDCEKYIAYKNNSDGELWVLYGSNYLNTWDQPYQFNDEKLIFNHLSTLKFSLSKLFIKNFFKTKFY